MFRQREQGDTGFRQLTTPVTRPSPGSPANPRVQDMGALPAAQGSRAPSMEDGTEREGEAVCLWSGADGRRALLEPRPTAHTLRARRARGSGPTEFGEELLQVLLSAGVGQVSDEEPPRVGQVLLLFILPEGSALPGSGTTLQGRLGRRDVLFPEYLNVAPACRRTESGLRRRPRTCLRLLVAS